MRFHLCHKCLVDTRSATICVFFRGLLLEDHLVDLEVTINPQNLKICEVHQWGKKLLTCRRHGMKESVQRWLMAGSVQARKEWKKEEGSQLRNDARYNESVDQHVNEAAMERINESVIRWIQQWLNRTIDKKTESARKEWVNDSMNHNWSSPCMNERVKVSVNQWINESVK